MADRDKYVYMAKLAEQAEKYDEMVRAMKHIAQLKMELSVEERNLLSVGYKNIIGSRRASWRIITTIEEKEEARGEKANKMRLDIIKDYRTLIEKEMEDICTDVLKLLDEYLIPSSVHKENRIFFYKMKGDYYRYMAEFVTINSEHCGRSLAAYKEATDIVFADNGLPPTHPIRLGLILNFSVFFYEILGERVKAVVLAKEAFEEAITQINTLTEECYRDTTLIMQLLRDNLTVWTAELEEENRPGDPEPIRTDLDE